MENISEPTPIASQPASAPSALENGFVAPLTLGLVICGGIGALLFTVVYLIEGATRPGYDAMLQPISALSLGPGGWIQQVNFVVYGVLLALSTIGWYRLLTPGRAALWFPLFQGISGFCLIGAGFFSMDPFPGYPPGVVRAPSTMHGTLHSIFAWTLILTLALGCFTLTAYFWRLPHWRRWGVYSVITGILILVSWGWFVQGASGTVATLAPISGLSERLSAVSHDLWLFLLTAALLVQHRRRSG